MRPTAKRDLSVADLQGLVDEEFARRRRRTGLTRAARLFIVQRLSAAATPALLTILGCALGAIAISFSFAGPRIGPVFWLAALTGALGIAHGLAANFRNGAERRSRPFQWRTDFTACLLLVGAAFGGGALILAPAGTSISHLTATLLFFNGGAFAAGLMLGVSAPAAAALLSPVAAFSVLAALRQPETLVVSVVSLAFGAAACAVFAAVGRYWGERARRRHPSDPTGALMPDRRVDAAPARDAEAA